MKKKFSSGDDSLPSLFSLTRTAFPTTSSTSWVPARRCTPNRWCRGRPASDIQLFHEQMHTDQYSMRARFSATAGSQDLVNHSAIRRRRGDASPSLSFQNTTPLLQYSVTPFMDSSSADFWQHQPNQAAERHLSGSCGWGFEPSYVAVPF